MNELMMEKSPFKLFLGLEGKGERDLRQGVVKCVIKHFGSTRSVQYRPSHDVYINNTNNIAIQKADYLKKQETFRSLNKSDLVPVSKTFEKYMEGRIKEAERLIIKLEQLLWNMS